MSLVAANPRLGDIMPGTGGARKLRIAGRSKGKSGGYRLVTYYAADDVPVLLLALTKKGITMSKLGARLIRSAKEAKTIARGEADPKSYRVSVPRTIDIKALRAKLALTQEQFSARFNLNVARLRDWEQGRSQPDSAVRAYLTVIEKEPGVVDRVLRRAS